MKKVLIIAYDFPPFISVGGLRPYSFYRYLNDYGYHPVVVTRHWDEVESSNGPLAYVSASKNQNYCQIETEHGTIIQCPYFPNLSNQMLLRFGSNRYIFIRRLLTLLHEIFQWILPIGNKKTIYSGADTYLQDNHGDITCIIATGDPFILFQYAARLSQKYGIPWVADYRDLWSQDLKIFPNKYYILWNQFLEKKCLSNVSSILTVSEFLRSRLMELHKEKDIRIIPNGYLEDSFKDLNSILPKSNVLSIAFAGSIYEWHPVSSVLNVFHQFVNENTECQIEFLFYGVPISEKLLNEIHGQFSAIQTKVKFFPPIKNSDLLQRLAQSHVLLLFSDYLYSGTKIYDYLRLNRKIILCYTNDAESSQLKEKHYYKFQKNHSNFINLQEDIITKTHSGILIENAIHLKKVLKDLYEEFEDSHTIQNNSINVEIYSRRNQVKRLAEILSHL